MVDDMAPDGLGIARAEAVAIIAAAEAEAAALLEEAERRARSRADAVIEQYQERLDALLDEEREVRARLEVLGMERAPSDDKVEGGELADDRDLVNGIDVVADSSLADFMKATLRHEVHPD